MRTLPQEIASLLVNEVTPRQKRGESVPPPKLLTEIARLKTDRLITHQQTRWLIAGGWR